MDFSVSPIILSGCHKNPLLEDESNMEIIEQLKESLAQFVESAGMSRIYIYPNFSYCNLSGPRGYISEINTQCNFDPFITCQPLFRTISFYEIAPDTDIKLYLTDECKDKIRKCIPLQTPNYPKLTDGAIGQWSCALGRHGSMIGIYSFEERFQNEQVQRYYIGVHSGIHYQTQDILQQTLTEQAMAADNTKPQKYADIFLKLDTFERLRAISLENNNKLAILFSQVLGLQFYKNEIKPIFTESMKCPVAITQDHFDNSFKAYTWWPPNSPAYIDSIIGYEWDEESPDHAIQAKVTPPKEIELLPIGGVLKEQKEAATTEKAKAKIGEVRIKLEDNRRTVAPAFFSEYNTIRMSGDVLLYYNNCCPTTVDVKEANYTVIEQLSVLQGYEVHNSIISQNESDKHNYEYTKWKNKFGDGFPVTKRLYKTNGELNILPNQVSVFFSLFNNISPNRVNVPKQLRHFPRPQSTEEEAKLKQDLYPNGFEPNKIQLQPRLVYFSPDINYDSIEL